MTYTAMALTYLQGFPCARTRGLNLLQLAGSRGNGLLEANLQKTARENVYVVDYLCVAVGLMDARSGDVVHAGWVHSHTADRRRGHSLHPTDFWPARSLKNRARHSQRQRYHRPNKQ